MQADSPVGFLAVTFPYLTDSEDEDIVPRKKIVKNTVLVKEV